MKKKCQQCKNKFEKTYKTSKTVWKKQRFCGMKCFGESMKGRPGYWLGKKRSDSDRLAISIGHKGQHSSPATQFKKGQLSLRKGKKFPNMSGKYHYAWKGGVTPINEKIRHSTEYRVWRKAVFTRDDYTCQACGIRGGSLHADHELPFAYFPDLRFEVLNGRTLCPPCHKKTPTYGGKIKAMVSPLDVMSYYGI